LKLSNSNAIEAPESDYLYVSQSQIPDAGNGLFTAIDLYKDETVSIFNGEILSVSQATKRVKNGTDQYFINLLDGRILDSMYVECFAKYANDADGTSNSHFKNNCRIALDEEGNVCIQAIKNIKANQELFCSYGKRYWRKHG